MIDAELDPLPTGPAVPDLRLIRRRSTSGRTGSQGKQLSRLLAPPHVVRWHSRDLYIGLGRAPGCCLTAGAACDCLYLETTVSSGRNLRLRL